MLSTAHKLALYCFNYRMWPSTALVISLIYVIKIVLITGHKGLRSLLYQNGIEHLSANG